MVAIQRGIVVAALVLFAGNAFGCAKKASNGGGAAPGFNNGYGGASSVTGTGGAVGSTGQGGTTPVSSGSGGGAVATGTGGATMTMMTTLMGTGGSTGQVTMDAGASPDGGGIVADGAIPDGMVPAAQCESQVMASGTTITDCERCLCQPGHCQAELKALDGDTKANALIKCTKDHPCADTCCVCGSMCDALGTNYGMGPCTKELEEAAGVAMPGAGVGNAGMLMSACPPTTSPPTSCSKALALAQCVKDHCMDACPQPPACM